MAEKWIDADDGTAYTSEEMSAFYTGKFKKKEILQYLGVAVRSAARSFRNFRPSYDG